MTAAAAVPSYQPLDLSPLLFYFTRFAIISLFRVTRVDGQATERRDTTDVFEHFYAKSRRPAKHNDNIYVQSDVQLGFTATRPQKFTGGRREGAGGWGFKSPESPANLSRRASTHTEGSVRPPRATLAARAESVDCFLIVALPIVLLKKAAGGSEEVLFFNRLIVFLLSSTSSPSSSSPQNHPLMSPPQKAINPRIIQNYPTTRLSFHTTTTAFIKLAGSGHGGPRENGFLGRSAPVRPQGGGGSPVVDGFNFSSFSEGALVFE